MKNQSQLRIAEPAASPMISLASGHTLTEQVLARLREDILSGQLAASQKLRVRELTARTGWALRRYVKPWHVSRLTASLPMRATEAFV